MLMFVFHKLGWANERSVENSQLRTFGLMSRDWAAIVLDPSGANAARGSFVDKVPHCAFFLRINKSQFSLIFSGSGDLYINYVSAY